MSATHPTYKTAKRLPVEWDDEWAFFGIPSSIPKIEPEGYIPVNTINGPEDLRQEFLFTDGSHSPESRPESRPEHHFSRAKPRSERAKPRSEPPASFARPFRYWQAIDPIAGWMILQFWGAFRRSEPVAVIIISPSYIGVVLRDPYTRRVRQRVMSKVRERDHYPPPRLIV